MGEGMLEGGNSIIFLIYLGFFPRRRLTWGVGNFGSNLLPTPLNLNFTRTHLDPNPFKWLFFIIWVFKKPFWSIIFK